MRQEDIREIVKTLFDPIEEMDDVALLSSLIDVSSVVDEDNGDNASAEVRNRFYELRDEVLKRMGAYKKEEPKKEPGDIPEDAVDDVPF